MEIGLAVGGAFLSSFLNVLFDRLTPQGILLNMFQRDKTGSLLLKKLRRTLLGLQVVLTDAESKQTSNPSVRDWLNEFRDAVDSAENLIEQINYEALKLKVESQHQVSDLNLSLTDECFLNIKEKLEDTVETLEGLEIQIGRLGLNKYLDSGKQEVRKPSTSVVDEPDIFGRKDEIRELVERLVSVDTNEKKLTVIPIVGMAGVGKTTLAKAVYNDEKVKMHFELKAWICVSESYDALGIIKGILQEIGSLDVMMDNANQLQIKLKESLKGKKFLIALDDVWNDNYDDWNELRTLFVQGKEGSKILVTTRKESVAGTLGNDQILSPDILSSEDSWSLFKRHAFEKVDPKNHQALEKIGKEIADKCKGLPLALKTLAGMLRSKSDVEGWRRILRSEIWELPNNGILPALMLSYNDLPAHLKRCFAYCAIFPKDFPFCKEQVIHLWIANSLVEKLQQDGTIEDSGNQYFLELRSRSLFERVPDSTQSNTKKYLMHDLVNDLAHIASSKLCIRLEDSEGTHMLGRIRHLSFSLGRGGDFEKLKSLEKLEQLRTLLPINIQRHYPCSLSKRVLHNILPRLTSLRALSLSDYDIFELPDVLFIKLRLLRFSDFSRTRIKRLPDSICALYNLETLLLSSCTFLEELPLQMEKLINLRHLDISNTFRLKMQLHLSKLKSLPVLLGAKFFLGGGNGDLRIGELGEVHNLYGSLSIKELQNVTDRREAMKAKMREKEHVEKLSLEWSGGVADNSQEERDILDELQPSTNIKELQLIGYRGTRFPGWLADDHFCKLVRLHLANCKYCYSLPALGQLLSLKSLTISGMDQIIEVTEEFYGSPSSVKPFNSLEQLQIGEMLEWKEWGNGEFPALQYLSLSDCPKLTGKLPENLCSLTELRISKCAQLILDTPIPLSCFKRLTVVGSTKVGVLFDHAELFASQLQGMKQITELYLADCEVFDSFSFSTLPNTLKRVSFIRCGKLKLEPLVSEMISSKNSMFLEELDLEGCDSMDKISPEFVPRVRTLRVEKCQGLTRLLIPTETEILRIYECQNLEILSVASGIQTTSLLKLYIYDCEKMKSLPERMQELLPSLNILELQYCPEIESFPEGGLPFSLEVLWIINCRKLVNGRKEWRLQRLPSLNALIIYDGHTDEEFDLELPASIRELRISNLKTSSAQFQSLEFSVLNYLMISYCNDQILSLPLSASLSTLNLSNCPNIQSLPAEGLQRLTSLRRLEIWDCKQLQSLAESVLPSSLSELKIGYCANLKYLPVKGMPSSISTLSIFNCPLLEQSLEFEKGDYWPKIAHIPTIKIDGEYQ